MKNIASIPARVIPSLFSSMADEAAEKPVSILTDLNDDRYVERAPARTVSVFVKVTLLLLTAAIFLLLWQLLTGQKAVHLVATPTPVLPKMSLAEDMATVAEPTIQTMAIIRDQAPQVLLPDLSVKPALASAAVPMPRLVTMAASDGVTQALMVPESENVRVSPLSEQPINVNDVPKIESATGAGGLSIEAALLTSDVLPADVIAAALAGVPGVQAPTVVRPVVKKPRVAKKPAKAADGDVEIITAIIEGRFLPQ